MGGNSSNEGRVEICLNDEWGTVCDQMWDVNDAVVVCRQLGMSSDGKVKWLYIGFLVSLVCNVVFTLRLYKHLLELIMKLDLLKHYS